MTRFVAGDAARAEYYDGRHGLPAGAVKSVCEDRDGNLWVCTPKGLAIFHPGQAGSLGNFTVHLNTPKHTIRIRLHPDGGLWVFTLVSLNRFYQGRLIPYLNYQTFVTSVAPVADTADGDLLFGYTSDRIFQVQRASGAVTAHKLEVSCVPHEE